MVELEKDFLPRLKWIQDLDDEKAKRAINLLHSWGECIHFRNSPVLSKYLIFDPTFLTQKILSALFNPDYAGFILEGKLPHSLLRLIWPSFADRAEFLLALMEKFEVCFELRNLEEEEEEVIIPFPFPFFFPFFPFFLFSNPFSFN